MEVKQLPLCLTWFTTRKESRQCGTQTGFDDRDKRNFCYHYKSNWIHWFCSLWSSFCADLLTLLFLDVTGKSNAIFHYLFRWALWAVQDLPQFTQQHKTWVLPGYLPPPKSGSLAPGTLWANINIIHISYFFLLVAELPEAINWFRPKFLPAAIWNHALKLAPVFALYSLSS